MRTPVSHLAVVPPSSPSCGAGPCPGACATRACPKAPKGEPGPSGPPGSAAGSRLYWSTLPIDCLYCDARLKDTGVLTPAGGIRCGKCEGLHYVLLCAGVQMAYVAKVSSADLHRFQRTGLTAQQILAELGAPMRPASSRRRAA